MPTHKKHELFISALEDKNLMEITFKSRDKGILMRTCVPLDFGQWRKSSSSPDIRYHFMDLDSSSGVHPLSIKPENILDMQLIEKKFQPENIITWVPEWHISRDWGIYS